MAATISFCTKQVYHAASNKIWRAHEWRFGGDPGRIPRCLLGLLAWIGFIVAWHWLATSNWVNTALLPTPWDVVSALQDLFMERGFSVDVWHSLKRISISFLIALAIAMPVGICMGTFPLAEIFFNSLVSPFRYLPAPSFIPLLLMWMGTGDDQKIALLTLGVVFFLTTLIMDRTKEVNRGLIESAQTLGAKRTQLIFRVILPAALPHYLTTARQMLALSWTYLVIAEIVAATSGIGAMMMRARRVIEVDDIMAGILIIGILGFASDFLLRKLHRTWFHYLY